MKMIAAVILHSWEKLCLKLEKIRKAYEGIINENTPIYLIMDNAGGDRTKDCIKEYVKILNEKYKIIVKH